jgi:hypothetical protein
LFAAGLGALFMQPPGASYAHPAVFLALLAAAAIASVFKVELPLSQHGATMSLSFAFEFASLLMLGTHATMVIAASSAWVQGTAARGQRNPLHRTAFSMAGTRRHLVRRRRRVRGARRSRRLDPDHRPAASRRRPSWPPHAISC